MFPWNTSKAKILLNIENFLVCVCVCVCCLKEGCTYIKNKEKAVMNVVCCIYGVSLGELGPNFGSVSPWFSCYLLSRLAFLSLFLLNTHTELPAVSLSSSSCMGASKHGEKGGSRGPRPSGQDATLHPALSLSEPNSKCFTFSPFCSCICQLVCLVFLQHVKSSAFVVQRFHLQRSSRTAALQNISLDLHRFKLLLKWLANQSSFKCC